MFRHCLGGVISYHNEFCYITHSPFDLSTQLCAMNWLNKVERISVLRSPLSLGVVEITAAMFIMFVHNVQVHPYTQVDDVSKAFFPPFLQTVSILQLAAVATEVYFSPPSPSTAPTPTVMSSIWCYHQVIVVPYIVITAHGWFSAISSTANLCHRRFPPALSRGWSLPFGFGAQVLQADFKRSAT